jgi:hypothetical protein
VQLLAWAEDCSAASAAVTRLEPVKFVARRKATSTR